MSGLHVCTHAHTHPQTHRPPAATCGKDGLALSLRGSQQEGGAATAGGLAVRAGVSYQSPGPSSQASGVTFRHASSLSSSSSPFFFRLAFFSFLSLSFFFFFLLGE